MCGSGAVRVYDRREKDAADFGPGNKSADPQGKTVLFRGLAISDPDKLQMQGHWSKEHFEKVEEMGAMIVRIPVHPVAWRERTPAEYLKLLDEAVGWCTGLGMYVDIDWHSIGNLTTGLFQVRSRDHQVPGGEGDQLDCVVLRSGVGADGDSRLAIHADAFGRVRQGGDARGSEIGGLVLLPCSWHTTRGQRAGSSRRSRLAGPHLGLKCPP